MAWRGIGVAQKNENRQESKLSQLSIGIKTRCLFDPIWRNPSITELSEIANQIKLKDGVHLVNEIGILSHVLLRGPNCANSNFLLLRDGVAVQGRAHWCLGTPNKVELF